MWGSCFSLGSRRSCSRPFPPPLPRPTTQLLTPHLSHHNSSQLHFTHLTYHITTLTPQLITPQLITAPLLTPTSSPLHFSHLTHHSTHHSWPAAAFRMAGAVHRASWRRCGTPGRHWGRGCHIFDTRTPSFIHRHRPFFTHHLSHTIFHTPSLSHHCVPYHLSHIIFHTTLSHTIFHTQLCHTPSFTHHLSRTIFDTPSFTHHLSHTTLSPTIFHTHNSSQLHFSHLTHHSSTSHHNSSPLHFSSQLITAPLLTPHLSHHNSSQLHFSHLTHHSTHHS